MTKRFCDLCGEEITNRNNFGEGESRLKATIQKNGVKLGVEVIQFHNGVANSGDVCKHCILDALYRCDDRPKAA